MKKKLIILDMVLPTVAGYAAFFHLFYLFQKYFSNYRWYAAVIPFTVITGFFIKSNMREWKNIKLL